MINSVGGAAEQAAPPMGPDGLRYRLRAVAYAAAIAAIWLVLWLGMLTLENLYHGTNSVNGRPPEQTAVAQVRSCQRVGPVSWYGYGYWWQCRATIHVADGRVVEATLTRSIASPADIGRTLTLREACFGKNHTNCRYGLPSSDSWGFLVAMLHLLERVVTAGLAILAAMYLLVAIAGPARARAVFAWMSRRGRPRRTVTAS